MNYLNRCGVVVATGAIIILYLFIGISGGSTPALASDNATANVTQLVSPDLAALSASVEGLRLEIEEAVPALVRLADFTDRLFEALIMFAIIIIALWQKKDFLNIIASLVTFFVAITWLDEYTGVSIALLGLAAYFMYKVAFLPLYNIVGQWRSLGRIKLPWRRK